MGLLTLLASLYYIMIWVTGTDKKVWIQIVTGLLLIRPSYTTESTTPKPSTPKPATQTPQIPSGCAPYDAALYKAGIEGITTLAKALHNQINTKDVKFTKTLSEYQRFHNSYYSLNTIGTEEYKSTKSRCEARGGGHRMFNIRPMSNIGQVLRHLEADSGNNFKFDNKKIWVALEKSPQSEIITYYDSYQRLPTYWGSGMTRTVNPPLLVDSTLAFVLKVPEGYTKDSAFTFETVAATDKAWTLCQADVPFNYDTQKAQKTAYSSELSSFLDMEKQARNIFEKMSSNKNCFQSPGVPLDDLSKEALSQPKTILQSLINEGVDIGRLFPFMDQFINDLHKVRGILLHVNRTATLSPFKDILCVCLDNKFAPNPFDYNFKLRGNGLSDIDPELIDVIVSTIAAIVGVISAIMTMIGFCAFSRRNMEENHCAKSCRSFWCCIFCCCFCNKCRRKKHEKRRHHHRRSVLPETTELLATARGAEQPQIIVDPPPVKISLTVADVFDSFENKRVANPKANLDKRVETPKKTGTVTKQYPTLQSLTANQRMTRAQTKAQQLVNRVKKVTFEPPATVWIPTAPTLADNPPEYFSDSSNSSSSSSSMACGIVQSMHDRIC
jgi:hypothetical protein